MWQFKTITSTIFKRRTIYVDNFVFRCYYRGCFWILVIGSLLVSARQFFGAHIHCIAHKSLEHVIDTFCFFSTTFTVVKHSYSKSVAHPGVGPVEDDDVIVYHAYYQWVPFFLFFQAMIFYIPHWIWKRKENKRLGKWVELKIEKKDIALRLLIYRDWGKWMVISEVLNIFNLIFQVYLTNVFLQGKFMDLGYNYDDLGTVFPKMTKCTWRQYGPSGSIQKHDALCVIALNIINEKIFIILWYWYIILGILSLCGLFWRIVTLIFHRQNCFNTLVFSTIGTGARLKVSQSNKIARYTNFSEWLLVYYLGKNLKPKDFSNVIAGLGPQLRDNPNSISYPDLKCFEVGDEDYDVHVPSAPDKSKLKSEAEESDC